MTARTDTSTASPTVPSPLGDAYTAALLATAQAAGGPLVAIDASTPLGSLALIARETSPRVRELELPATSMPSEALAMTLAHELKEAGLSPRALAGIVVGLGPGSFTGLRVALATVKGLAMGAGAPVYGVSSLALIAGGAGKGLVAPVLDARRGELFCALYDVPAAASGDSLAPRCLIDDMARPAAAFAELVAVHCREHGGDIARITIVGSEAAPFVGTALSAAAQVLPVPHPRASVGVLLARDRVVARQADALRTLVPRYLRVSEAERMQISHLAAPTEKPE